MMHDREHLLLEQELDALSLTITCEREADVRQ